MRKGLLLKILKIIINTAVRDCVENRNENNNYMNKIVGTDTIVKYCFQYFEFLIYSVHDYIMCLILRSHR